MKLRKLKKITIGDTDWTIEWNKKIGGASFNYVKKKMVIGCKCGDLPAIGSLLHELKEIINVEQGVRYINHPDSDNFYFFYSHDQHNDLCARLSGLLSQFII